MALLLKIANPWRGARVYVKERTASTMDDAAELARAQNPTGTAVVCGFQTGGRGRVPGRKWLSSPWEALLMTVLLSRTDVPFPPAELPLRAALAVSRAVDPLLPSASLIKWPNDVMFGGRKLAGVLCEGRAGALLVGVGVNCRQREFPPELAEAACSILQVGGAAPGIADVAGAVLSELHGVLRDPAWLEGLRSRLDQRGRAVVVTAPGSERVVEGVVEDVSGSGGLLLRAADGSLVEVPQGEIRKSS